MATLHQSSLNIIRAGQAPSGAYIASPTFSQYGYSWLRDGAWIAHAMALAGEHDSAEAFHRWAARTIERHTLKVDALLAKLACGETPTESDYLPTRFTLDSDFGKEEWPNFQLDGYGAWLWSLAQYCGKADHPLWRESRLAVVALARYLAALWRSPNYDCWEEHRQQIHTATLAAIYGGLNAARAVDPALIGAIMPPNTPEQIRSFVLNYAVAPEGHFVKFLGHSAVDASLLWVALPYRLVELDDPRYIQTVRKIERDLHVPNGGVYRYLQDTYYGGGEWILLTAWLGWVMAEQGRMDEARNQLRWIEAQAAPSGELPEQVQDHLLDAAYYPHWVKKWGDPACPLLWSHAMYLILEARLKDNTR